MNKKNKVAIIMGSKSDWGTVKKAQDQLKELDINVDTFVYSAHRTPQETLDFARNAKSNGYKVIIAAAGMAAHLAGFMAAWTTLPIVGLPLKSKQLDGVDALLSSVQMPPGVPVAVVGIDSSVNAALYAAEILALEDPEIAQKLEAKRKADSQKVIDTVLD